MPRKSKNELSMAPVTEARPLPAPPPELTADQAQIWHSVVRTKPADWFQADTHPLLAAYCKSCTQVALLDQAIDRYQPNWLDNDDAVLRLEKLTAMRCKLVGKLESCATKLRLTQQARYDAQKAATVTKRVRPERMPWEP